MKFIRIATIAFVAIIVLISMKYKIQYQVSLKDTVIGYVDSQTEIDGYIAEKVALEEGKNIAFVDLEDNPVLKLELVSRTEDGHQEELKEKIMKLVNIQYTNYAVAINGENKVYVTSKEEAEEVVAKLKAKYAEKYTKTLGIVQEFSDNYEEIASISIEEANTSLAKVLESKKKADNKAAEQARKLAIAKKQAEVAKIEAAPKSTTTVANTKATGTVNGIKLAVRPVSGTITSRFGKRSSPGGVGSTNHKGLDIAAPLGTAIHAVAAGTVTFAGYNQYLGNYVVINHGSGVETYYGHCSKLYVSKGKTVEAGTTIAAVGKTGSATGYHLHLEIHINGTAVNPQKYIY